MKISRISKKLESDYKKRRNLAHIGMVLSVSLGLGIIIMAITGYLKGGAFILVYVGIGLIIAGFSCFVRLLRLAAYTSTLSDTVCKKEIKINENGITAEFRQKNSFDEKLFKWDDLKEMKGFYIDLSYKTNSRNKYRMASITNGAKREMSAELKGSYGLRKMRKAAKDIAENEAESKDIFTPSGVIVELYDEMLVEIRKYWKKEEKE